MNGGERGAVCGLSHIVGVWADRNGDEGQANASQQRPRVTRFVSLELSKSGSEAGQSQPQMENGSANASSA